jgi:hypothetical protein
MKTSDGPPMVAIVTAGVFRPRNMVMAGGAFVLAVVFASFATAVGAFIGTYIAGIIMGVNDRQFLAEVQARRLGGLPGRAGLMARDIEALPEGPIKDAFQRLLPRLGSASQEQLATVQKSLADAKARLALPAETDSVAGEVEFLKQVVDALGSEGGVDEHLAADQKPLLVERERTSGLGGGSERRAGSARERHGE